jgi:ParB-like chromosome segregation protein Spo0J
MSARILETLPLDQLTPWPRNARTHSRKQIRQIAESIRRFGFTNPVLIDGENRILAGNGRVEAARELGLATAPCLRRGDHPPGMNLRRALARALSRPARRLRLWRLGGSTREMRG